jgi:hypothetical protein
MTECERFYLRGDKFIEAVAALEIEPSNLGYSALGTDFCITEEGKLGTWQVESANAVFFESPPNLDIHGISRTYSRKTPLSRRSMSAKTLGSKHGP